jgi:hypothetical protein
MSCGREVTRERWGRPCVLPLFFGDFAAWGGFVGAALNYHFANVIWIATLAPGFLNAKKFPKTAFRPT